MKANSYQVRDQRDGHKIIGGSRREATLDLAADALVKEYDMEVTGSGRVVFMHKGIPVSLYLFVDPEHTEKGRALKAAHYESIAQQAELQEELRGLIDVETQKIISKTGSLEATLNVLRSTRESLDGEGS